MNTAPPPEPPGEPTPEEIERAIAAFEEQLQATPALPPAGEPVDTSVVNDEDEEPGDEAGGDLEPFVVDLSEGETRRVRELRAQVAEAHHIAALQADQTPLLVDTDKVRRRRLRVAEAARLHALDQDPAVLAYRDQRVRRAVTAMVFGAAGIALAASSIGVQASVATALGLKEHSLGWWAAFLVEPALSLPLLATVSVQAYSAIRGRVVDRKSPEGRKLFRTEAVLLALTLVLNCWPAFAGADDGLTVGPIVVDPLVVIVHALGPVAAITAVLVLPYLWSVLAVLPVEVGAKGVTSPLTGLTYRQNAQDPRPARGDVETLVKRAQVLITSGELPPTPSANKIQKRLRCGMDDARAVRDRLAQGGAS